MERYVLFNKKTHTKCILVTRKNLSAVWGKDETSSKTFKGRQTYNVVSMRWNLKSSRICYRDVFSRCLNKQLRQIWLRCFLLGKLCHSRYFTLIKRQELTCLLQRRTNWWMSYTRLSFVFVCVCTCSPFSKYSSITASCLTQRIRIKTKDMSVSDLNVSCECQKAWGNSHYQSRTSWT